jgi:predicted PhzF superfamily epimerase YddE/YHI9
MSTETPPPGTPSSVTAAPAVASAARTPHPLAQEVTVASSPRAAVEVMDVDALEEAQPQHSKLSEVVQTDSHIAVAALASLPRPDGA